MENKLAKVYIIGAGPGDPELITLKAVNIIKKCPVVIYAGSLVSKDVLIHCMAGAEIYDSAEMDLDEIINKIKESIDNGKDVARLHTGDPCFYGATGEQMLALEQLGIDFDIIPGISSLMASAAALKTELTLPEISQTVTVTRVPGRTPVPEAELLENTKLGGTIVFFLSANRINYIREELVKQGWDIKTPAVVVYRASWEDQKIVRGTLEDIEQKTAEAGIKQHALVFVGKVLDRKLEAYSKLYDREFKHEFRQ